MMPLLGRMMGDLQVGLGFRPGFGQQSDPALEPSSEQQTPQPVDAVADDATVRTGLPQGLRRLGAGVPVSSTGQALGGVRRLPGASLRSWASSTLVP